MMASSLDPLVSVIIPVFNDGEGIAHCLQALGSQSCPAGSFEIIVVDNGSTVPIVLPAVGESRVSILRCMTPGSYAARNKGAHAANGTILAFTDADCIPDPDWLKNGITALKSRGATSIIGGEVAFIAPAVRTATACYQLSVGFQQAENIKDKGFSATANLFCAKTLFEQVGSFEEQLLSGGDREWAWRARRTGATIFFEPGAVVRTLPRTSLQSAVRQARRVAAGRHLLAKTKDGLVARGDLRPHRSIVQSVSMLLQTSRLSTFERLKVIAVASILRLVAGVERLRIRLGGAPERR